jgi:L-fuculose-phosphate aldolase
MTATNETITALRDELADYGRRAFYRGLTSGVGGNMSVRLPGRDAILITPTGVSLAELAPEDGLLVDLDGKILENPMERKPSMETGFHLACYKARPDTGAVIHLHPPYATAWSNRGLPLPLATVSARHLLGEVPCIECAMPGTRELYDFVTEGVRRHPGVKALLMREHGILALAPDLKAAYYIADIVEDTAKVAFIAANIRKR